MSALDIIRIMCIKMGKLEKLPKWRFISRKNISIKIIKLYNEFLDCDIYEKMSILASMLIQINTNTPYLISTELEDTVKINTVSIEIPFKDDDTYPGSIRYTPKTCEFVVNLITLVGGDSFNVSKDLPISSFNKKRFDYICDHILNNKFLIIISNLSYAINNHMFDTINMD